jgi:uncharacterized membrane protein
MLKMQQLSSFSSWNAAYSAAPKVLLNKQHLHSSLESWNKDAASCSSIAANMLQYLQQDMLHLKMQHLQCCLKSSTS